MVGGVNISLISNDHRPKAKELKQLVDKMLVLTMLGCSIFQTVSKTVGWTGTSGQGMEPSLPAVQKPRQLRRVSKARRTSLVSI